MSCLILEKVLKGAKISKFVFCVSSIWGQLSSLEMSVPSQGHYGFHSFPVVD